MDVDVDVDRVRGLLLLDLLPGFCFAGLLLNLHAVALILVEGVLLHLYNMLQPYRLLVLVLFLFVSIAVARFVLVHALLLRVVAMNRPPRAPPAHNDIIDALALALVVLLILCSRGYPVQVADLMNCR